MAWEQGLQLELARSAANDAVRAVALQHHRIKHRDDEAYFALAGFRHEMDVAFLLLALRWLREACQLVAELMPDKALTQALADFDRRLPAARDLRDVREHLRQYVKGSGNLQKDSTEPERFVSIDSLAARTWLGHDELSHFIWAGQEIRLDEALPAAELLFQAMRQAIAPYVAQDDEGQDTGVRLQPGAGS